MRIGFVWTVGGPEQWDDNDLETGIGGSEAMMILYAREFARMGHQVHCFAPCRETSPWLMEGVWWGRVSRAAVTPLDVLIAIRNVGPLAYTTAKVKALMANDQSCPDLGYAVVNGDCNLVITISKHQYERYQRQHPIDPALYMICSAGVVSEAYTPGAYSKVPGRCLYSSTPERGLIHFKDIWPRIHEQVPHAQLWITGGFELYGWDEAACEKHGGGIYRRMTDMPNVAYLGPISRSRLQGIQQQAELLLYPSTYDEMCCITALEMAAAGCPIVTTDRAALSERVIDGKTGYLVKGTPGTPEYDTEFVEKAVKLLTNPSLSAMMGGEARVIAKPHSYRNLCQQWLERFESMLHG